MDNRRSGDEGGDAKWSAWEEERGQWPNGTEVVVDGGGPSQAFLILIVSRSRRSRAPPLACTLPVAEKSQSRVYTTSGGEIPAL